MPDSARPSTTRLDRAFSKEKTALIPFLMAGYPDKKVSLEVLCALPEAGADIIELGMPFSDPVADGETIQAAGLQALKNGTTMQDVLAMVYHFRQQDTKTPIILMGYINPIYKYGADRFMHDAATAGVDGLILVDLPIEEEAEFSAPAQKEGIELVHLISPVTPPERVKYVSENSSGFLYYVSLTGITGTSSASAESVEIAIKSIQQYTELPVGVGFGISTPEQAAALKGKASAIIIGSAIIKKLTAEKPVQQVQDFIRNVKKVLQ